MEALQAPDGIPGITPPGADGDSAGGIVYKDESALKRLNKHFHFRLFITIDLRHLLGFVGMKFLILQLRDKPVFNAALSAGMRHKASTGRDDALDVPPDSFRGQVGCRGCGGRRGCTSGLWLYKYFRAYIR